MASYKNDIELVGDKELMKTLDALRNSVKNEVMRPALAKGAKIAKTSAQSKVTSKRIRKLIAIKKGTTKRGRNKGSVYTKIMVRSGQTGTGKDKKNKYGTVNVDGREVDFSVVGNFLEFGTKNAPAKPFMRPAVSENRSAIQSAIKNEVKQSLVKVVRKRRAAGKAIV